MVSSVTDDGDVSVNLLSQLYGHVVPRIPAVKRIEDVGTS